MSTKVQHLKVLVRRIQSLPTLPQVVHKLMTMVESPDVSPKDVGKLISTDQVLGARVLRLVNSPFYGFPGRISSISHAIILLGFNVIKGVVLSASVFELMERTMVGLWEHSLGSAVAAGTLGKALGMSDPEEISTAALLHDIGKVLVKVSLPDDYAEIERLVTEERISFREAELKALKVDHAQIGQWLSREWNLPERLSIPITWHHEPEEAVKFKDRCAAVHVSDALVRACGVGNGGDPWVPKISQWAWETLGMDRVDLKDLMKRIMEELEVVEMYHQS
ncbi:MAG TPA: HDOD domain-containing protein [Deltaproteobacteria bacterium]|nr:HDOD domain-containing protein [Deltaproteobacteria bacterium]HOM28094.1 HDOD domain-containing protein [Deltaproteobacteria bacterium]HPP80537.1 HDOD domain-containing protein [Deltaproteobacteria bacterium]